MNAAQQKKSTEKDHLRFQFLESDEKDLDAFLLNNPKMILSDNERAELIEQKNYVEKVKSGQKTKNQHYVPAFYLEKFSNSEWKLHVIDMKSQKVLKKTYTPSSVCSEDFFYWMTSGTEDIISQTWEGLFWFFENQFSERYAEIIQEIMAYGHMSEETLWDIAEFMAISYLRTKDFRENLQKSTADFMKRLGSMSYRVMKATNWEDERVKKISGKAEEMILKWEYNIEFQNNVDHFNFLNEDAIQEWTKWFMIKKWRFYIANWDLNFVTSNVPVLELNPDTPRTIYGYHIAEREHIFPLSPKILVVLSNPHAPWKKVKREQIDDDEVAFRNTIRLSFSEYWYSPSVNELDEKLAVLSLMKHQWKFEYLFPHKFSEPWKQ